MVQKLKQSQVQLMKKWILETLKKPLRENRIKINHTELLESYVEYCPFGLCKLKTEQTITIFEKNNFINSSIQEHLQYSDGHFLATGLCVLNHNDFYWFLQANSNAAREYAKGTNKENQFIYFCGREKDLRSLLQDHSIVFGILTEYDVEEILNNITIHKTYTQLSNKLQIPLNENNKIIKI